MELNQEFVEQLEEIDNYTKKHHENHLTSIVLKQIRKDFIDSYLASFEALICKHTDIMDEGCFNYENHLFVEASPENAKYRKYFCPTCKCEKIIENKEKTLKKIK